MSDPEQQLPPTSFRCVAYYHDSCGCLGEAEAWIERMRAVVEAAERWYDIDINDDTDGPTEALEQAVGAYREALNRGN